MSHAASVIRENRIRVLMVEDEALVRMALSDMLAELGCDVVAEAYQIEQAEQLAGEAAYDLLMLDLNLRGRETYAIADLAIKRGKAVILATGYAPSRVTPGYEYAAVLQKPFTIGALDRAVKLAMSGTQAP
jgi:DNA-binding NarL/FixJ family response regulator